ncbi:Fungal Zn(2)-Cys(6) binuclear cluster domain [Geosmithia morbida]|uniref:Fungal Zn(2)-Cys(6) binuclear cluster domain n=1 Tax=Geosmithia morbida TaxID=1094350 RepID=A0A9P5D456_9HYPO|nr:Fungal Zn(2)-Cys(6) binuclear cluster domain [Geosmithia morbida]KAF4121159.1 Fungal Zn(2)-Cys(6) binuclear cluster domain [Geosmithia morbida]
MAPPKDRKRKFHRRSKNGCNVCKKRHVRCDEKRPLCTNCLQTGDECIYSPLRQDGSPHGTDGGYALVKRDVPLGTIVSARTLDMKSPLSDYVGGSYEALPDTSKRLLRHLWGQQPVNRELESSVIHKAFETPGYMHMCLMLSACQWAWVRGSMDDVRIPFMYHKSATYQFAREQLRASETAQSGATMLAISSLALAEVGIQHTPLQDTHGGGANKVKCQGAIGDLDTSTKHLNGFRLAMQGQGSCPSLAQEMLKMAGNGLRASKSTTLVNVPDYQPTFMALLFASIWDISTLPPREAPKYGWWEENDTQAARLWQNHTKELNLNYEISRGFDPNTYMPRILNGDPKSSRTCFIATFFYLFSEVGNGQMDAVLVDWILEQLIDDVNTNEESIKTSAWSGPLWLWCVMFGAAIASSGKASSLVEDRQLRRWIKVYDEKIRLVSKTLGLDSWGSARRVLGPFLSGSQDEDVDKGLMDIWERACGTNVAWDVEEVGDE